MASVPEPELRESRLGSPVEAGGQSSSTPGILATSILANNTKEPVNELLERVRACTGATGAVIALRSGEDLYCRATAGTTVPELGTRLEPGNSLTSLCFHTGQSLLCEDSELDTRVNSKACQALGIRSVRVVPLKRADSVVALLELLSNEPHAFGGEQTPLLNNLEDKTLRSAVEQLADDDSRRPEKSAAGAELQDTPSGEQTIQFAEAAVPLLAEFGHPSARSRLPGLLAITVVLSALVVGAIRLTMAFWPRLVRPTSQLSGGVGTSGAQKQPVREPTTGENATISILSAGTNEILAKIKGQQSPNKTGWAGLKHAAQSNDSRTEYEFAVRYASGEGVRQDYSEAMRWFAKAAAHGNPSAQWKLALGYLKGIGVPQDDRKAAEWFRRAANQAHIGSQFALSEMYLNGRGGPVDYVRAYTWAAIAMGTSNRGEQQLRNIAPLLTPSDLEDANRRITMWWGRRATSSLR